MPFETSLVMSFHVRSVEDALATPFPTPATCPPEQRIDDDADVYWRLEQDLVYQGRDEPFTVPECFETDLASVPGFAQWLIHTWGRHTEPAVLHDYLYKMRELDPTSISASDADGIFRRAMFETGVPFWRRWVTWGAVRWASLVKSGFRDGPEDLPQLVLITIFPGSIGIVGSAVVVVFLVVFTAIELVTKGVLAVVKRVTGSEKMKPVNPVGSMFAR